MTAKTKERVMKMNDWLISGVVGALLGLSIAMSSGCSMLGIQTQEIDVNAIASAYYNQPNNTEIFTLTGVDEISLKGTNMQLAVNAPVETKRMIDIPESQVGQVVDSVVDGLLWGTLGYYGINALGGAIEEIGSVPKTVNPVIVQPEVIQVP